jgi:hypothetical protein
MMTQQQQRKMEFIKNLIHLFWCVNNRQLFCQMYAVLSVHLQAVTVIFFCFINTLFLNTSHTFVNEQAHSISLINNYNNKNQKKNIDIYIYIGYVLNVT